MERWIPIAKIVRPHGRPREGVLHFKARLENRGTTTLHSAKEIGLSDTDNPKGPYKIYKLADNSSPLGGSWDRAEAVILGFSIETFKDEKQALDRWVALDRKSFPQINDSEVYLCDLMGLPIYCEKHNLKGKVSAFYEIGSDSINLEVKNEATSFQFPMKWIDWSLSDETKIVVPQIEEWIEL